MNIVPDGSAMSQLAINADRSMGLPLYPVNKIYADPDFNCRGHIQPIDVIDLAKDIVKHGLQQPIVITLRRNDTPDGYDYVIVAGHRRHRAYQINKQPEIPAVLRTDLDDFSARTLNAIENLKRQNLNIKQEARTVLPYYDAGWSRDEIAKELNVSPGWVQMRVMLLELPEDIQDEAAAGMINQTQLRELHRIKDRDKRYETAKKFKEAKERGESAKVTAKLTKENRPNAKRRRTKTEVTSMMELIVDTCGGNNITTRTLAWANGDISDLEWHESFKMWCKEQGYTYNIPPELR
jgi:ParB/RepB/Spo0J family partition protein